MHNRLKQFLAAENITQAQFADRIRIGKANVSHVLAGRNKPGYDFISAIMTGFPELNLNWLFFGTGKMYNNPSVSAASDEQLSPSHTAYEPDLFSANYNEEHEVPVNFEPTIEIDKSGNITQEAIKQRVVSKIIILFDDGTYQEL